MKYARILKLAWWNCSLLHSSPAEQKTEFYDACDIIRLLKRKNCDIVALCEIPPDGIAFLNRQLACKQYHLVFCVQQIGRTRFDFALLLKKQTVSLIKPIQTLHTALLGNTLKIGCRADVALYDGTPLHLFLSHFPSRLQSGRAEKARAIIYALRQILNRLEGHTVLMGDFNTEPYDEDLSNGLYATRDRHLAARKAQMFYNPFWAQMQTHRHLPCAGNYYYAQGLINRWYTFNQMMFSASLLNESGWHLRHQTKHLFAPSDLLNKIRDRKHRFDHIPIICELERLCDFYEFYPIPK